MHTEEALVYNKTGGLELKLSIEKSCNSESPDKRWASVLFLLRLMILALAAGNLG